jgi:hypothetical protein
LRARQADLGIILTAGFAHENRDWTRPSRNGILRIDRIASLVLSGHVDAVAIIGGYWPKLSVTEADVYAHYFHLHYPELSSHLVLTQAKSSCTNHAIFHAARNLRHCVEKFCRKDPDEAVVGVVSYPWHTRRASMALRRLGGFPAVIQWQSGEMGTYPLHLELLLCAVTLVDPAWNSTWIGRALANRANSRL